MVLVTEQCINVCNSLMYFGTGCDAVELNVLKDILGEPANDEFAAELDTQAKTSGMLIVFTSITFALSFLNSEWLHPSH